MMGYSHEKKASKSPICDYKVQLGEKRDGTRFARLVQQLCEYLEQSGERVDSFCKKRNRSRPTI